MKKLFVLISLAMVCFVGSLYAGVPTNEELSRLANFEKNGKLSRVKALVSN